MKIAFMVHDKPNFFSGPVTNARRLLPELHKRGHQVHCMILAPCEDTPTSRYLEAQDVQCHVLVKRPYTETKITWILKQLQQINPDVFVPNIFVSGYYAAKWVQQAGIPAIAALRSNDEFHWQMIREFVVGDPQWTVAGLVCVSHQLKQEVEKLKPQQTKLCVIPSGVPIPQKSSSQIHPLKIAYVGRLVQEQKQIRDILEAFIQLTQTYYDITFTFFGEGNERPHLEKRVQETGLDHRIYFAGVIPSEELHQQLLQYNVIVLLSNYEGTPGAIMDGMACGLVPVCTDISGGVKELVIPNQTGFLVRDRADSFYHAIQTLYNDPKLRVRLANNAKQHIINEYSLEVATTRWENFCQELISTAQPRSQIQIPQNYNLPPVQNCRDFRHPPVWKRAIQRSRRLAGEIKRKVLP